jgi:hypothetical protein
MQNVVVLGELDERGMGARLVVPGVLVMDEACAISPRLKRRA